MSSRRTNNPWSAKLTRRKLLKAAGAGAAWIALTDTLGCKQTSRTVGTAPSTTASAVQSKPARQVAGGRSAEPRGAWAFRSRPDLSPPAVEVTTRVHNTAPGYIFVAPKAGAGQDGPMIVDDHGQVVWFHPMHSKGVQAMNFKAQFYRGEPVLTWWQAGSVSANV